MILYDCPEERLFERMKKVGLELHWRDYFAVYLINIQYKDLNVYCGKKWIYASKDHWFQCTAAVTVINWRELFVINSGIKKYVY